MFTQANYCSEFRLPFTVYKQILQKILDIAQRKISIKSPEEDIYNSNATSIPVQHPSFNNYKNGF